MQSPQPTSTPAVSPTSAPASPTPNIGFAAAAATATITATLTATPTATNSVALPTPTPISAAQSAPDQSGEVVTADEPLTGTIITNRSDVSARFFLEGATYLLAPSASRGVNLPRSTSVLNLYNCDADVAESQTCFWDPYMIQQHGLYEVYAAPSEGSLTKLLLREAGAPPSDHVWIQNRTGHAESIVFRGEVHELNATAMLEFPVAGNAPAILYVRHCLNLDGQTVCEWTPKMLESGAFYALVENSVAGTTPGSTITAVDIRPVVGGQVLEMATPAVSATTPVLNGQVVCQLEVPVLNVRSGPGLQYQIIDKIRTEGATPATVSVTGRSVDNQWLTVDPALVVDGWITSSTSFITCNGNLTDLPLVQAPPLPDSVVIAPIATPLAPAQPPVQAPSEAGAPEPEAPDSTADQTESEPTPQPVGVPSGLAMLLVNNGFQHEIRVTIDQQYRPEVGPSEYDLQPGGSTTVVVFPGSVAFTVSSAWRGLSRNTTLEIAPDTALPLWLRFESDASDSWYLAWD